MFTSKATITNYLFLIYEARKDWAELCSLPAGRPSVSRELRAYKAVYLYESVHTHVHTRYVDLAGTMLDLGLAGFRILHVLFIDYQPVFRSADGLMNEAVSCLAGMDLHRIKQRL